MRPMHSEVPDVMPGHDLGDRISYCIRFLKVHAFLSKEEAEALQDKLARSYRVDYVIDAYGCPHEKTPDEKQKTH